jgi:Domain of unknown function (DUF4328)
MLAFYQQGSQNLPSQFPSRNIGIASIKQRIMDMARTCQCPTCGRQFNLADELTNTFVPCPSCQTEVRVSASEIQAVPPMVGPADTSSTEPREEHIVAPTARHQVRRASPAMAYDMEGVSWPASLPKGRATFAVAMLGASVMMDLVSIGAQYLQYLNLDSVQRQTNLEEDLDIFEIVVGLSGLGQSLVYIVTAVAFCMWFYRAYKNLKVWRIPGLKYSPGWAVGYFFIPILNLFRPYQIAQEIWKASDPRVPIEGPQWRDNSGSSVVGAWWAFWLIANFVGQIDFRLRMSNIADQKGFALVGILSDLLSITAAAFALLMIFKIQARQAQKLEIIFSETDENLDS